MYDDITDKIYEAAFLPEQWSHVLDVIGSRTKSASGAVLVYEPDRPPSFRTTELTRPSLEALCASGAWRHATHNPFSPIASPYWKAGTTGFVCDADCLTPDQMQRDSVRQHLESLGLAWQLGTWMALPRDAMLCFTFERRIEDGRHEPEVVARLDRLRPHLARAGLLTARLSLEAAQTAVATLAAIGLPAAALNESGRVLAANTLVETADPQVLAPTAYGGLAIKDPFANDLYREAIREAASTGAVRSIPVRGTPERPPVALHLVPVRGAANDLFPGAAFVLVVARIDAGHGAPDLAMLHGLFNLAPAEARLAAALASGRSLNQAAEGAAIKLSTARSYLEAVFRKTGTRQQSQLVALLKSIAPLAP